MTTIQVREVIGPYPQREDDARTLSKLIRSELEGSEDVLVDFTDVNSIRLPFLMGAIGSLCEHYSEEELHRRLRYAGLRATLEALIPSTLTSARRFYALPQEVQDELVRSQHERNQDD